jgi:hypothetical protein
MDIINCFAVLPGYIPGSRQFHHEHWGYGDCRRLPFNKAMRNPDSLMAYAVGKFTVPPNSDQTNLMLQHCG